MTSRNRYRTLTVIHERLVLLAQERPVLAHAEADVNHCLPHALQAFQRMQDARPGTLGAQAYDAPSVGGGTASSAPERQVVGPRCCDNPDECRCRQKRTIDPNAVDRRNLDRWLNQLLFQTSPDGHIIDCAPVNANAYNIRRLVDAWTPHAATDKQRQAVTRANDPEAECAHHRTFGTFEPVHRTTDGGGLLATPTPLCRWCYDRLRTDGRLPSGDRMQRLADGRGDRVKVPEKVQTKC